MCSISNQILFNQFETIRDVKFVLFENLGIITSEVKEFLDQLKSSPNQLSENVLQSMFLYQISLLNYLTEANLEFAKWKKNNSLPHYKVIASPCKFPESSKDNAVKNSNDTSDFPSKSAPDSQFNNSSVNSSSHETIDTHVMGTTMHESIHLAVTENLTVLNEKLKQEDNLNPHLDTHSKSNETDEAEETSVNIEFQLPEKDVSYNSVNFKSQNTASTNSKSAVFCAEEDASSTSTESEILKVLQENNEASSSHQKEKNNKGQSADPQNSKADTLYSAEVKLNSKNIANRREEAIKSKLKEMPNLKMIPYKVPNVIKNDLQQDEILKKPKVSKNCNQDIETFEVIKHKPPKIGSLCVFSHVDTPDEFYIHIVEAGSLLLDDLSANIQKICERKSPTFKTKDEAYKKLSNYCFAFIPNYNEWYRVLVLDWNLPDKKEYILVQLVDYGNKCYVYWKDLRKMTKEIAEIPIYAIKCHLPLLYPPKSTPSNRLQKWPETSITAMLNLAGLIENEEDTLFKIVFADQHGDSLGIDLFNIKYYDELNTVGQLLIDIKEAVQISDEDMVDEHPELEEFLGDIDELENAENLNEAVLGYDAKDEQRICRFTKPDGTCNKKNCTLEHVPLSADGFTTDKKPTFSVPISELPQLNTGDIFNVLITNFDDSCNFCAQVIFQPKEMKNGYSMDTDLYNLMGSMNNKKNISTYKQFKVGPCPGEIVIAKWKNKWIRGMVRELLFNDFNEPCKAQVYMVDFGNVALLPLNEVREMTEEFMKLPFQLVRFSLYNVEPIPECKKNLKDFVEQEMYNKNFLVHIKSNYLPYMVQMTTISGRQQDVSEVLLKKGFVQKRTFDPSHSKKLSPEY